MTAMAWLHHIVVAFICWSVFCRARLMTKDTHPKVKFQYGALMLSAIAGLPIFGIEEWAPQLLGAGMCIYLVLDAEKWRRQPPKWLHDLTERELRRMFGTPK